MAVSLKPYIGSRDFYPTEMEFRNWLFTIQRQIATLYGYSEYGAPLIEPISLYQAKSSDEIVSEQLYRFTDRGEREVAIRPEMTPTLARMVAARAKELPRPMRWFSIANFMRYERPGRGRLREFWQLNVDLLGSGGVTADCEILALATDLMYAYGASVEDFELRYSDRRLLESAFALLGDELRRELGRLLDKRDKLERSLFDEQLAALAAKGPLPAADLAARVEAFLALKLGDLDSPPGELQLDREALASVAAIGDYFERSGRSEVLAFDPAIVRGFDYYTGLIFEINDTHPDNRRALFGGGRYDRLLGLFGKESIPAVGFGMGDVTLEHFIDLHGLRPRHLEERRGIMLTLFSEEMRLATDELARDLRRAGLALEQQLDSGGKFGKQLESAEKKGYRYVLILGEEEHKQGRVRLKDLATGEQKDLARSMIERVIGSLPAIRRSEVF